MLAIPRLPTLSLALVLLEQRCLLPLVFAQVAPVSPRLALSLVLLRLRLTLAIPPKALRVLDLLEKGCLSLRASVKVALALPLRVLSPLPLPLVSK